MSRKSPIEVIVVLISTVCLALNSAAATAEQRSDLKDQSAVAVTIYNQDLALVKEVRKLQLKQGMNNLALREVSAKIRPETAQFRSLSHSGSLQLLEQNFDFDLLTPGKLLEKFVGKEVGIIKTHPTSGRETQERAVVLSAQQGVVLKIGDRIESGIPGRIVYDSVPANLRDRPTLVLQFNNKKPGKQDVELSYLTGGLSWQADYVAELNDKDTRMDLNGWVTLTNTSGTSYPNAKLQLVAGDINRVQDMTHEFRAKRMEMEDSVVANAPMQQQGLFEYHLYTLNRPTTIADRQTKQVALLNASNVPVIKELVLQGNDYYYRNSAGDLGQKLKVAVYVKFKNDKKSHLGMPLPKGTIRMYKKDKQGNAQFVGEDGIDHSPKNETVKIKLGNAFDVTADKTQTDFKKRSSTKKYHYAYESAYRITLKNAKDEAVEVTVREPIPGDWKMVEASHKHQKVTAGTASWRITVPAQGKINLQYRVLVRY